MSSINGLVSSSQIVLSDAAKLVNSSGKKQSRLLLNGSNDHHQKIAIKQNCFAVAVLSIFDHLLAKIGLMERKWAKLDVSDQNGKKKTILININSLCKRTVFTRSEILSKNSEELSKLLTLDPAKKSSEKPKIISGEIAGPCKTKDGMPVMEPLLAGTLYQMMYHVDQIFQKHNIEYCVDGGTTLGALRHEGLIPHDDDLDVYILPGLEAKLNDPQFIKDLDNVGLEIHDHWLGAKIYPKKDHPLGKWYKDSYQYCQTPSLDVFFTQKGVRDGKEVFNYIDRDTTLVIDANGTKKTYNPFKMWPKYYHEADGIRNANGQTNRINFGPIKVNASWAAKQYCHRGYGPNCFTEIYLQYDHVNEKALEKKLVKLTDFRRPAFKQWSGIAPIPNVPTESSGLKK